MSNDNQASGHVANLLNRLNTILHDETRKAAPHSCLLHTASTQIYIIVAKLALSSDNPDVINGARQFFHILINGEAEGVLDSKIFARSLIDLVRRNTLTSTIVVDEKGEADLVELLFEIATKIRVDPDILPAWFYPERDQSRSRVQGAEARRNQFPLFYLLVEYVHLDGPQGDFARTGLLYLTDIASRSKPLEKWMIESDLAPQMASGLCALYSRLSRQAYTLTPNEKALPIIALSDISPGMIQMDDTSDDTSEEFQENIKSFLSYLAFWQDTLDHCKSTEVKDTLLDHFQVLFVQQLLYPSLLESSDVAGGSTSAVILHLCRMLESLNAEMAKGILQYLLAANKQKPDDFKSSARQKRMSISRRKSMEKLASIAEIANCPSPDLFNLLDLLTISLRSSNAQTVNASLKLITVILQRHHQHVLSTLFRTSTIPDTERMQDVSQFTSIVVKLFNLSSSIAQIETADESYQAALSDGQILLQRHSCALYRSEMLNSQEYPVHRHAMFTDCKLFEAIVDLLRNFFANDSITNITLTETVIALASCEHILLQDWISNDLNDDSNKPNLTLIGVFEELVEQLKEWKSRFTEWDLLFSFQRARLANASPEHNEIRSSSPVRPSLNDSRTGSPQPRQTSSMSIRTSTTHGRKPPPEFASIDGTLARSPKLAAVSPRIKAIAGSPLTQTSFPGDTMDTASVNTSSTAPSNASLAQLQQQVALSSNIEEDAVSSPVPSFAERLRLNNTSSMTSLAKLSGTDSGSVTPSGQSEDPVRKTASLSHIITNAVILQEFMFEIAAMLQIRATLFDEVDLIGQSVDGTL